MWGDLTGYVRNYGGQSILVALLLCIAALTVKEHGVRDTLVKFKEKYFCSSGIFEILFYIWTAFILESAILSRRGLSSSISCVFTGFAYWNESGFVFDVIENVLIFVPVGFLLMAGFRVDWMRATIITFLFSLGIELTQLIFVIGEFQFSDLLNNTLGGFFGAYLYKGVVFLNVLIRKRRIRN